MMNRFSKAILASAVLGALVLSTIPAHAAGLAPVNVPFNFTVNGKTLPAGRYTVQVDAGLGLIRLISPKGSAVLTLVSQATKGSGDVTLHFEEQNGMHALDTIRAGNWITPELLTKSNDAQVAYETNGGAH